MTCIIGMEHDNKVYLCGDSAGSDGWSIKTVVEPKVFRVGEFIMGGTTSFRMLQLLQYHLSVRQQEKETDFAYMVFFFGSGVPARKRQKTSASKKSRANLR